MFRSNSGFNQLRAMTPEIMPDNATVIAWDCAFASLAVEKWALVRASEDYCSEAIEKFARAKRIRC